MFFADYDELFNLISALRELGYRGARYVPVNEWIQFRNSLKNTCENLSERDIKIINEYFKLKNNSKCKIYYVIDAIMKCLNQNKDKDRLCLYVDRIDLKYCVKANLQFDHPYCGRASCINCGRYISYKRKLRTDERIEFAKTKVENMTALMITIKPDDVEFIQMRALANKLAKDVKILMKNACLKHNVSYISVTESVISKVSRADKANVHCHISLLGEESFFTSGAFKKLLMKIKYDYPDTHCTGVEKELVNIKKLFLYPNDAQYDKHEVRVSDGYYFHRAVMHYNNRGIICGTGFFSGITNNTKGVTKAQKLFNEDKEKFYKIFVLNQKEPKRSNKYQRSDNPVEEFLSCIKKTQIMDSKSIETMEKEIRQPKEVENKFIGKINPNRIICLIGRKLVKDKHRKAKYSRQRYVRVESVTEGTFDYLKSKGLITFRNDKYRSNNYLAQFFRGTFRGMDSN